MDTGVEFDPSEFHYPNCRECKNGAPDKFDWRFIPLAVCISLKDRNDRTEEATKQFHKVGLCKRLLFYRPEKDRSRIRRPGTRGCWESHRRVARLAQDSGLKRLLIFEDDVLFDDAVTPSRVSQLARQVKGLGNSWSGLFLGSWPIFARPTLDSNSGLLRSVSLATHAYIANQPLLNWMRDHPFDKMKLSKWGGLGIDCYFALQPKMYSTYPMMAYQSGSVSSNPKPKLGGSLLDFALSDPKYMKASQYAALGTTYVLVIAFIIAAILIIRALCRTK